MGNLLNLTRQEVEDLLISKENIKYSGRNFKFCKDYIVQIYSESEKKYINAGTYKIKIENDSIELFLMTDDNYKYPMPLTMQIIFAPHGEEMPLNSIII